MQLESLKWLEDLRMSAENVQAFAQGRDLAAYSSDLLLRKAIEREFITIGEALIQLRRIAPDAAARITAERQIVGFRNQLVHHYWVMRDELVWHIVTVDIPVLIAEARQLLAENDPTFDNPPATKPQEFDTHKPQDEA
jgi:uncharacterized protein with HEPN domain